MKVVSRMILLLLLIMLGILSQVLDGPSNYMGMDITQEQPSTSNFFSLKTTGGRFVLNNQELLIEHALFKKNSWRRVVLNITFSSTMTNLELLSQNLDNIVFKNNDILMSFYADSTMIISSSNPEGIEVSCGSSGEFSPEYVGRYGGQIYATDTQGGFYLCNDRNKIDYKLKNFTLVKDVSNYEVVYSLGQNERLMVSTFPGREFNWNQWCDPKFNTMFIICSKSINTPVKNCTLPDKDYLRQISKYNSIVSVWHKYFYSGKYPGLPDPSYTWYGPFNDIDDHVKAEFRRFITDAHDLGLKVILYAGIVYYLRMTGSTVDTLISDIEEVKAEFDHDGYYIDGLPFNDYGLIGNDDDMVFQSYEIIRRLRGVFGKDGILFLHDSQHSRDDPLDEGVSTVPSIDAYTTFVKNVESSEFETFDVPLIKYQTTKFGISKTIAYIKANKVINTTGTYYEKQHEVMDYILDAYGKHQPTLGSLWPYHSVDNILFDEYRKWLGYLEHRYPHNLFEIFWKKYFPKREQLCWTCNGVFPKDPKVCNFHGQCLYVSNYTNNTIGNGLCQCDTFWELSENGECIPECTPKCSSHGKCVEKKDDFEEEIHFCECFGGYWGPNCGTLSMGVIFGISIPITLIISCIFIVILIFIIIGGIGLYITNKKPKKTSSDDDVELEE